MHSSKAFMSARVVDSVAEVRRFVAEARRAGKSVGLVPTMGALHQGHVSLVKAARHQCDVTVVTIFVNPAQFGPGEDFERYPRDLAADVRLLGDLADIVFAPTTTAMYTADHATYVEPVGPALALEGTHRPGHFRGVATIVLKLFNIVQPDCAFFGRKDYQQALVVRKMVADLDLPIQIEVCPTVREPDGLALSSRNAYLSPDERRRALSLSAALRLAQQMIEQGGTDAAAIQARMRQLLEQADVQIDYAVLADPQTLQTVDVVRKPIVALIAGRVGRTRLIDNELIS